MLEQDSRLQCLHFNSTHSSPVCWLLYHGLSCMSLNIFVPNTSRILKFDKISYTHSPSSNVIVETMIVILIVLKKTILPVGESQVKFVVAVVEVPVMEFKAAADTWKGVHTSGMGSKVMLRQSWLLVVLYVFVKGLVMPVASVTVISKPCTG